MEQRSRSSIFIPPVPTRNHARYEMQAVMPTAFITCERQTVAVGEEAEVEITSTARPQFALVGTA